MNRGRKRNMDKLISRERSIYTHSFLLNCTVPGDKQNIAQYSISMMSNQHNLCLNTIISPGRAAAGAWTCHKFTHMRSQRLLILRFARIQKSCFVVVVDKSKFFFVIIFSVISRNVGYIMPWYPGYLSKPTYAWSWISLCLKQATNYDE